MLSYDTLPLAVFAALLRARGVMPRPMLLLILIPFLQMVAAPFAIPGVALLPIAVVLMHRLRFRDTTQQTGAWALTAA